jgi:hypothetical protein
VNQEKEKKGGLIERIAEGYFYGEGNRFIAHKFDDELSQQELRSIRKIRNKALGWAALAGACGVAAYYLPTHFWPEAFAIWDVKWSVFGTVLEIPVLATLFGVVLAILEIYLLVFINIRAVHKIAVVCGFPDREDPDFDLHVQSLVNIGIEKNAKNELSIGLNPWQGYTRYQLLLIFVWNKVKATLSNMLFKMIIRKILGRYALRIVVDLAGIPVFASWNAYTSAQVLKQARVRILAPSVIQYTILYLRTKYANNEEFKHLVYDILQFLAIKKRSFHENHYLLSINLLRAFNIDPKSEHPLEGDFYEKLKTFPQEMQEDIAKLLVVGIIIDGSLSPQEKRAIRDMGEHGVMPYDVAKVKHIMQLFSTGSGIDVLKKELHMLY